VTGRSAEISACGTYRYVLRRTWNYALPELVYVMLNPSTADATEDDATIRKCCGFARRFGFGGIVVVNLFALRSRDPKALRMHAAPIGVDNDTWIMRETADPTRSILVAWGCHARHFPSRVKTVCQLIARPVSALRVTKDGHPEHPVMLPYSLTPTSWTVTP